MAATLSLPEELLLLCLDDEKGTFSRFTRFGITGAVLVELIHRDRLALTMGPPKWMLGFMVRDWPVISVNFALTGDEVLDSVLQIIGRSKRQHSPEYWVSSISLGAQGKRLISMLVDRLVQKGILVKEEHRLLWVIPVKRYPAQDERTEDEIVAQLRRVLLEGAEPDERTAALIGLASACRVIRPVFVDFYSFFWEEEVSSWGAVRSVLDRAEPRLDRVERKAAGRQAKLIVEGRFHGTDITDDAKACLVAIFKAVVQAVSAELSGSE